MTDAPEPGVPAEPGGPEPDRANGGPEPVPPSGPTEVVVNCDGGARGNPGPAALGVSIQTLDGVELEAIAETIGHATNNVAEYSAVLRALERCAELGARTVQVRTDSMLLVEQLNGNYKVKNPGLRALHAEVRAAAAAFERVTYEHVRRAQNARADQLVNIALDAEIRAD